MSYFLSHFGDLAIPLLEAVQQIGTPVLPAEAVNLPSGGAYRLHGSDRRPRPMHVLRASGEVDGEDWGDVAVDFDALRAAVGTYGQLWRTDKDTQNRQWAYAELLGVEADNTADYVLYQPVSLQFAVYNPVWNGNRHGVGWVLDSGILLDTGYVLDDIAEQYTLTDLVTTLSPALSNAGNLPTSNVTITVTAAGTALTSITLLVNEATAYEHTLVWTGSVTVGQALVINSGARSVKNNTVDAYATFTAPTTQADWFTLQPGTNTVKVTRVGGAGSTILFNYSDAHA